MTTNSEARKRLEERQANCVCNPGDHCWTCGQPLGDSDNAVRPDDSEMVEFENAKRDTVTVDGGEVTYTPKVGDRVNWYSDGLYTVTAIGKQRALVVDENGMEFAAWIGLLTPIADTVTIEISREDAEELVRVVKERDDLMSSVLVGSWTFTSELRLKDTLQAALAGEK